MVNELYGVRSSSREELIEINSKAIKKCVDTAMLLGKLNYDLLACRRELIIPELNSSYRQLTFVQGNHPKLLFGDDLRKDISESNKIGQALKKQHFCVNEPHSIKPIQPQNFSPRGSLFYTNAGAKKEGFLNHKVTGIILTKTTKDHNVIDKSCQSRTQLFKAKRRFPSLGKKS